MSTAPKRKSIKKVSREFADEMFEKQKAALEKNRRKPGPKPKPDHERQGKNIIRVYANDKEYEIIKDYIGERSMSDVIRNLILDAADELENEY